MLYTEPRVAAVQKPLGHFSSFQAQQQADLRYGGQIELMRSLLKRQPERRPADTIPAPPTPPSR